MLYRREEAKSAALTIRACWTNQMVTLRRAAAPALIVYLMLLPKSGLQVFSVQWSAIQRTFDTAQECEKVRATLHWPVPAPAPVGAITDDPIIGKPEKPLSAAFTALPLTIRDSKGTVNPGTGDDRSLI
jgi:hypothetical protein